MIQAGCCQLWALETHLPTSSSALARGKTVRVPWQGRAEHIWQGRPHHGSREEIGAGAQGPVLAFLLPLQTARSLGWVPNSNPGGLHEFVFSSA